jgi:hypothetical protein
VNRLSGLSRLNNRTVHCYYHEQPTSSDQTASCRQVAQIECWHYYFTLGRVVDMAVGPGTPGQQPACAASLLTLHGLGSVPPRSCAATPAGCCVNRGPITDTHTHLRYPMQAFASPPIVATVSRAQFGFIRKVIQAHRARYLALPKTRSRWDGHGPPTLFTHNILSNRVRADKPRSNDYKRPTWNCESF